MFDVLLGLKEHEQREAVFLERAVKLRHKSNRNVRNRVEALERRVLMARPLGIDVSNYQATINWTSVKNSGRTYAWTKSTEGFTYDDPTYDSHVSGAEAANVYIAPYHYARYDNNSAANEVSHFLSVAGSELTPGHLVPMLDVEQSTTLTKTQVSQWVNDFCNGVLAATGIRMLVYTYISYATSYLNSSVTQWALSMAHYNGQDSQSGAPGGTSPWSTWNFWQYSSTASVPGISGNCDVDVINDTSISSWIIPVIPVNASPANNATTGSTNIVLDWQDCANATSYDVYVDGAFKANVASSTYTVPSLTSGSHSWYVLSKNNTGSQKGTTTNFTVGQLPTAPTSPNPANNAVLNVAPTKLDWADSSFADSYDVYLGTSTTPFTNTTISELAVNPGDGVRLWKIVAKNGVGSTSGPQWQYTLDRVAPAASYNGQAPTVGSSILDFSITYTDSTSGLNAATLDNNDVTVTGPNGYSANATFMSVDTAGNGSPRTVTYRIAAPGGSWNVLDNGNYTIHVNSGQVADVAGNSMSATVAGTISANLPFAWKSGVQLRVDFDGTSTPVELTAVGSTINAIKAGTTLSFTSVLNILATGTTSPDMLQWAGPVSPSMTFNGNGGGDGLEVMSGTYTLNSDSNSMFGGKVNLSVDSGATVVMNASQHLASLTVADGGLAKLSANGNRYLQTQALSIGAAGALDLNDNDLIVSYGTGPSAFSDVQGSVFAGYSPVVDSGKTGIVSSTGQSAGNTILVVLDNGLLGAEEWPLGSGNTIEANSVVGKYTYFGDANLDGQVTPDDYAVLDANLGSSPPAGVGWLDGDANLDGTVTPDDYAILDANLGSGIGSPLAPGVSNLRLDSGLRELLA